MNIKCFLRKINTKNIFILSFLLVLSYLSSFLKLSFAIGSHRFFFSGINIFVPLSGLFLGGFAAFLLPVFLVFKFLKTATLGIPTAVATLAWFANKKLEWLDFILRVILPLAAIASFVINSTVRAAFLYSFYWFIPVLIYFAQKFKKLNSITSIFFTSLSISFVAHAVGSIMWLYVVPIICAHTRLHISPLTCGQWIRLIPIVFFERLFFALGMTMVYGFLKVADFSVRSSKSFGSLNQAK